MHLIKVILIMLFLKDVANLGESQSFIEERNDIV